MKNVIFFVALFVFSLLAVPSAYAYTPVSGDVIRTQDSATVFLVDDSGTRIPLSASAYEERYDNNFSIVKVVTSAELGVWSDNLILNGLTSVPDGTLIMYDTDQPGIFIVENGRERVFSTWQGFIDRGYDLNDVTWVGQYTIYPTGTPIQ